MFDPLSPAQLAHYAARGYLSPLRVISAKEASEALVQLRASAARLGSAAFADMDQLSPQVLPWANALAHHPRIRRVVESVLGPQIRCGGGQFFIKEAGSPSYVSWHQDGTYWDQLAQNAVTAWLALTRSTPENGCMRIVPGSHREAVTHRETLSTCNLLSHGQEAMLLTGFGDAVEIHLEPGEMSLHHALAVHGSKPNGSGEPRIGFAIRYVSVL